jgi:predicted metal-binding protein
MTKIGIIICNRYSNCGGGKCFRAIKERVGAFSIYPKSEEVEVVGYSTCGGCPGGNIEYVPAEMIKNGAEVIHLATGLVVGYPPCPNIKHFVDFIKLNYDIPVVVGTHPIPEKYFKNHEKLSAWTEMNMQELAPILFKDGRATRKSYD